MDGEDSRFTPPVRLMSDIESKVERKEEMEDKAEEEEANEEEEEDDDRRTWSHISQIGICEQVVRGGLKKKRIRCSATRISFSFDRGCIDCSSPCLLGCRQPVALLQ